MIIESLLIMGPFLLLISALLKSADKLDKEELDRFIKKEKKEEDV